MKNKDGSHNESGKGVKSSQSESCESTAEKIERVNERSVSAS